MTTTTDVEIYDERPLQKCKNIKDTVYMNFRWKPVMYHSQIRPEWNALFMEMYRGNMTKIEVALALGKLLKGLKRKKEIKKWDILCILIAERHITLALDFFDEWIANGGVERMQELWVKFNEMPDHLEDTQ
tara:strand:- start:6567 stop:6959 length:393 start_codon:yes stop_codon:yes gene_type:complete